jgi:hypothetical protein
MLAPFSIMKISRPVGFRGGGGRRSTIYGFGG